MGRFRVDEDRQLITLQDDLGVQYERNVTEVSIECPLEVLGTDVSTFSGSLVMEDLPALNMTKSSDESGMTFTVLLPEGYTDKYGVRALQLVLASGDMETIIRTSIAYGLVARSPSMGDEPASMYPTILYAIDSRMADIDTTVAAINYTKGLIDVKAVEIEADRAQVAANKSDVSDMMDTISGYVIQAQTSADDADTSAGLAYGSAQTATTKAEDASGSADAAAASALEAMTYRDQAQSIVGGPYLLLDVAYEQLENAYRFYSEIPVTLPSTGWTGSGPYTQTIIITEIEDLLDAFTIGLAEGTSVAIKDQISGACIDVTTDTTGQLTFIANGTKPLIDIQVIVRVDKMAIINSGGQAQ